MGVVGSSEISGDLTLVGRRAVKYEEHGPNSKTKETFSTQMLISLLRNESLDITRDHGKLLTI